MTLHDGARRYVGIVLFLVGGALTFWSGFAQQRANDSGVVADMTLLRLAGVVVLAIGFVTAVRLRKNAN